MCLLPYVFNTLKNRPLLFQFGGSLNVKICSKVKRIEVGFLQERLDNGSFCECGK
jgi:hypothetical protein